MLNLPIWVITIFSLIFVVEAQFSELNTESIERILEGAEVKTIEQINKEIDRIVERMDEKTRKEHKEWKLKVEKEEKERKNRVFKVLPKLSTRTQQRLIRIVMTQQNQQLTVGEKERILRHISSNLDENTKRELSRYLSDRDLYSLMY